MSSRFNEDMMKRYSASDCPFELKFLPTAHLSQFQAVE